MTVQDLITRLQTYPPQLEIYVEDNETGTPYPIETGNIQLVEIGYVYHNKWGTKDYPELQLCSKNENLEDRFTAVLIL